MSLLRKSEISVVGIFILTTSGPMAHISSFTKCLETPKPHNAFEEPWANNGLNIYNKSAIHAISIIFGLIVSEMIKFKSKSIAMLKNS